MTSEDTTIVSANECLSMLTKFPFKEKIGILPGEKKIVRGIKIKTIRAYNLDKINPETKNRFIPKKIIKLVF